MEPEGGEGDVEQQPDGLGSIPLATRVRLPDQNDEPGRPGTVIHLDQAASTDGPPGRAFVDGERDLGRLVVIPRRLALQRHRSRQTAEAVRGGKVVAPPLAGRQQVPLEGSQRDPLTHDVDDRPLGFTILSPRGPSLLSGTGPGGTQTTMNNWVSWQMWPSAENL